MLEILSELLEIALALPAICAALSLMSALLLETSTALLLISMVLPAIWAVLSLMSALMLEISLVLFTTSTCLQKSRIVYIWFLNKKPKQTYV